LAYYNVQLVNVSSNQSGVYECTATNELGSCTVSARLTVTPGTDGCWVTDDLCILLMFLKCGSVAQWLEGRIQNQDSPSIGYKARYSHIVLKVPLNPNQSST